MALYRKKSKYFSSNVRSERSGLIGGFWQLERLNNTILLQKTFLKWSVHLYQFNSVILPATISYIYILYYPFHKYK